MFDDYSTANKAYTVFIENILYYQRIFEYSGDISSIMELPYCLLQDLIISQINLKKKEAEKLKQLQRTSKRSK